MDKTRYCVLWMPTRLHHEIEPVIKPDEKGVISIKDIETSDGVYPKILIDLSLLPTKDIECKAKRVENNKNTTFETLYLKFLDFRSNGLFLYKYEISDQNYLITRSNNNIINILYHVIKSFYHKHEVRGDADSMLTPYCSPQKIVLDDPNNQALLHYLGEFEEIFLNEYEHLWAGGFKKFFPNNPKIIKILRKEYKINKISIKDIFIKTDLSDIEELISFLHVSYNNVHNEFDQLQKMHIYYQTLLYSKYNKLFKIKFDYETSSYILNSKCLKTSRQKRSLITLTPHNENTNTTDIDFYEKAINIQNTIESIKIIYNDFTKTTNNALSRLIYINSLLTSKLSTINTIRYALIGVAASALFFIIQQFTYSPEKDINKLDSTHIVIQEKLREIQTDQTENVKDLKKLIEELNQKHKEKKTNTQP